MRGDVDVVVVGGGIGGLACALALGRLGWRVRVLERSAEFTEVGAGLQLAPNATRILGDWGVLDRVTAAGFTPRRAVLADAMDGAELTHLDLADVAERYGAPYLVIHRTDLLDVLLAACRAAGVDLVSAAEVTDVANVEGGAVTTSAGRRDGGQLVLVADGLGSTLRCRFSDDVPVVAGYVAHRGAVPVDEAADVGAALDDMVIHIGPGRHFVRYRLRGGSVLNQVAVHRTELLACGTPVRSLEEGFAGSCDLVHAGLAHLWRDRCWQMVDREPIQHWVDGRIALTGDAAHPMLQYLAQGACQAIEDAACLARHVQHCTGTGPAAWDHALQGYRRERTARTARVQRTARDWGDLWHADGMLRAVRNALLRDRDPTDYRHVDWLYG